MKDDFSTTSRPFAAAFAILRKGNKVAFVLRGELPYMPHHYGLPAGKVETGERFSAAAIREAKEEAGVSIKPEHLKHALTVHRYSGIQADGSIMEWVDSYFEVVKWEGEPYNTEPNMHDALEWLDMDNLPENTIPPVKAALEVIKNGQKYLEFGWN